MEKDENINEYEAKEENNKEVINNFILTYTNHI